MLFLVHPGQLACAANHGFNQSFAGSIHFGAGKQAGHALAHQCWRIGHGAHDALRARPAGHAFGGDASGHAQVQGIAGEGGDGGGRILEGLGLDGPDHQLGALQRIGCSGQGIDAEVGFQRFACCFKRLDHGDAAGRNTLADQSAHDGAGHIAAADESDGRECVVRGVRLAHDLVIRSAKMGLHIRPGLAL